MFYFNCFIIFQALLQAIIEEDLWLSEDLSVPDLISLCDPYPDDAMSAYRVYIAVNKIVVNKLHNNLPELMAPLNSL